MRLRMLPIVLCSLYPLAMAQTTAADDALLAKTRALYDAPFTRDLVSFDCAVQFDWKQHFVAFAGAVPPEMLPAVERLQKLQHRVLVDRSGASVSTIPAAPDLAAVDHAAQLEQVLTTLVSGGFSAWLPFATDVILPVPPTQFTFEKAGAAYKLSMDGSDVAATLLLEPDLRLTSMVSRLPQPMRLTTEFIPGPNGFLLKSMKTGSTTDAGAGDAAEATFAFTYQTVQGFQLPASVTITPATNEAWSYTLNGCKATRGVSVTVGGQSVTPR